jgi:hypothetical protein
MLYIDYSTTAWMMNDHWKNGWGGGIRGSALLLRLLHGFSVDEREALSGSRYENILVKVNPGKIEWRRIICPSIAPYQLTAFEELAEVDDALKKYMGQLFLTCDLSNSMEFASLQSPHISRGSHTHPVQLTPHPPHPHPIGHSLELHYISFSKHILLSRSIRFSNWSLKRMLVHCVLISKYLYIDFGFCRTPLNLENVCRLAG